MVKESSPEERLLNLIKGKKPAAARSIIPAEKSGVFAPKEEKTELVQALVDLSAIIKLKEIRIINSVLFFMLVAIIIYLFIDIFLIPPRKITSLEVPKASPEVQKESEIKPYSYYSKELDRNLFQSAAKEEVRAEPGIAPEEIIGNLALLGIVAGDNPQAIIEDKKQQKTFFLREGQSQNGLLLKRIEDGSVTVVYKGEEFTLSM